MKAASRQRWIVAAALACAALVAWDNWPRTPAAHDTGRRATRPPKDLAEIVVAPVRAAASAPAAAEDQLDTALIAARTAAAPSRDDAFAARSWLRPPPPAPPPPPEGAAPPPPPPRAPPLPYKLLGRLDETPDKTVWYLGDGERLVLASPGETLDGAWRFDGAEAGQLRFTYLPLDQPQRLPIGAPP
jgi:hypothetical protein